VPVLTVFTPEIASNTTKRIGHCSWQIVIKWFFFNRINFWSSPYPAKGGCVEGAVPVYPDPADPVLPVPDMAPVAAERTYHLKIVPFLILSRFVPVFHQWRITGAVGDKHAGERKKKSC
jgi:hypothetical protein